MKSKATVTIAALVSLLFSAAALAGSGDTPTAAAILDQYVEATGGQAAHEKIRNSVSKISMEIKNEGITFSVTVYAARPNLVYTVAESKATGRIEKGTDGEVAWEMSVLGGPQIMKGQQRDDFLREARLDKTVHWRDVWAKVEYAGVSEVDGKPCHKIVLTPKTGNPQTQYFDQKSHLLVKLEGVAETPAGNIPMEVSISDYKKVGDLLLAHKMCVNVIGSERLMTVESVKQNVKLPPDRFKLPDEIQAIVDKQNAEKAQPAAP